jgi:glycosyltransferase 2 family protein
MMTEDTRSGQWTPRTRAVSFSVAALLAAVLLYHSLRGIDWRQVAQIVGGATPGRLVLTAAIGTVTLFLRACRWRILLNAEGAVSVATVFWATAAGYFGNNFLPARAGELVRTFMISSRSTLGNTYVLATALSERVADAVALVVISAVVLLTLPAQPGWLAGAARPFAILGLVGALAIAVLPLLGPVARSAIERAPLPHSLRPRLITAMEHGLRGVRAFHDARRLSGFLGLTVLIWCLDGLGTVIAGAALGFRIPISVAFLLIAGLGLGSALPSTPGYVGIYQFVAVTVLTPFGFSRTDAIAYILVAQALTFVVIGFWGSLGLWRYRRTRRSR